MSLTQEALRYLDERFVAGAGIAKPVLESEDALTFLVEQIEADGATRYAPLVLPKPRRLRRHRMLTLESFVAYLKDWPVCDLQAPVFVDQYSVVADLSYMQSYHECISHDFHPEEAPGVNHPLSLEEVRQVAESLREQLKNTPWRVYEGTL